MSGEITVSASVVTYNDINRAPESCKSILSSAKKYPLKFYVIDNASSDATPEEIEKIDSVTLIRNKKNVGFGSAHNRVLTQQMGKYHFVINPDISADRDVIAEMVDFFEENPDVVMACPKILNTDGSEQNLPKEKPTFKRLFFGRLSKKIRSEYTWAKRQIETVTDINFCTGCFFGIRTEVFKALGGFDERYFMYLEDADITLKAKKYGRVVILPHTAITHEWERESAKSIKYLIIHIISSIKFLFKWGIFDK